MATVHMGGRVAPLLLFTILALACLGGTATCRDSTRNRSEQPVYADKPRGAAEQIFVFSSHPHVSEQRVFQLFSPLIDRINRKLTGGKLRLETEPDYPTYERRLYAGRYHFSLPNPLQTIRALHHDYVVFGKVSDDSQFRGLILARKDRKFDTVADLRGLKVSYPSPTAVAACMLPQMFLQEHGLDVVKDTDSIFTGNQESSINAVATGMTDVGVTWPPPWEIYQRARPASAATLRVLWSTPPLVNNGLVVRSDVPDAMRSQVAKALFSLNQDDEGRRILASMSYAGFEPASEATYAPVHEFLQRFALKVRPVEHQQ